MIDDQDDNFRRLHDLVTAKLDGAAAPVEQTELKSLLLEDPALRRLYVEYIQDTASLRWSFAHTTVPLHEDPAAMEIGDSDCLTHELIDKPSPRRALGRWGLSLTIAAAALIGAGAYLLNVTSRNDAPAMNRLAVDSIEPAAPTLADAPTLQPSPAKPVRSTSVATLTRTIAAVWENGHEPQELARLHVGQALSLRSGQIEMIFDAGVEVVVNGPARFEVRSAESIFSSRGAISVRVGVEGKGFTIHTPCARVIDLGTEFGVAVNDAGETEVAVFSGIVDLALDAAKDDKGVRRRLNQGEAIRVGANGHVDRVTAIASDRFPVSASMRSGNGPRERIIADVTDDIRAGDSNKFYRIVRTGLHEDSPAFVDRKHQWNAVKSTGFPLDLDGAEYVMAFNDDKFLDNLEVSIDVAQPANLYVFYSDSMTPPPWLKKDFVDTGFDIGLDEGRSVYHGNYKLGVGAGESVDTVFSVWKQEVRQPRIVRLGAVQKHRSGFGYNMYGIATAPLRPTEDARDLQ
jgi:hypothetical protein